MLVLILHTHSRNLKPPFFTRWSHSAPLHWFRQHRGDGRAPVSLTVREAMCPPSARYQYTFFTGRLFSEAAITLTISRSITPKCCRYDTSELVMILYYNVIDPAEGLTAPSGAEQTTDSPVVLCVVCVSAKYDKQTLARLHCTVNDHLSCCRSILRFIPSVAEIWAAAAATTTTNDNDNRGQISIACMHSPSRTQCVHTSLTCL